MALSDLTVRQAKTTGKRYTLSDNDCLGLMVSAAGGKSWQFRYYWLGKQKRLCLGGYPALSLREARIERDKAQALLARGIDPQVERDQKRHAAKLAGEYTFKTVFDAWVEHRRKELKEGRQSTLSQILRIFNKDVLPTLGRMSIYDIRRPQLLGVLAAIEKRKAFTTAEKVRTWFNQLFRYALVIAEGLEVNPAADLDVVAEPKPPVAHNPYLHLPEMPEFLQKLRLYNPRGWQTQLGVRLLFLTGVRTGELRLAEPEQFDLDRGLWIIPPQIVKQLQDEMRKAGKRPQDVPPYIVPLSLQAIEIVRYLLGVMRPAQKYLLSHRSELKKRISENTLNKAVQLMGYEGRLTGHGIRGTISTALNEIGYPKIWVDAQLSHSDPNKVSSSYNHAKYVEPRRRMMQDWADRLDLLEQGEVEAASAHLTIRIDGAPAMAEVEEAVDATLRDGRAHSSRRPARRGHAYCRNPEQRRHHVPAAVSGTAASDACPRAGSVRDPARARGNADHLRVSKQLAGPAVRQAGRKVQGPDQPRTESGQVAVHQFGQSGAACSRLATGAAQAQAGPGAHEPVPARGFVGSVPHADPAAP
ncbi:phage-related integrase [Pseudomonas aeruginosa]|nr:phage-related integrase [Pseudomonas aeruginosa]